MNPLFEIFVNLYYVLLINVSSFGQAIVELERPIDESPQQDILVFISYHSC